MLPFQILILILKAVVVLEELGICLELKLRKFYH